MHENIVLVLVLVLVLVRVIVIVIVIVIVPVALDKPCLEPSGLQTRSGGHCRVATLPSAQVPALPTQWAGWV